MIESKIGSVTTRIKEETAQREEIQRSVIELLQQTITRTG